MSQATFRFPRVHSQEQVRVTSDSGGATVVARLRADLRGQLQNLVGPDGVTTLYLQSESGTAAVTGTVPVDAAPVGQAAVDTAVAALVTGAPAALDTLGELAAALGDDANFAATITTALAARLTTVSHGSTAGTARPTSTLPVLWIGTVAPTNRSTRDLWMDETAVALKRWDGATWAASGGSSVAGGAEDVTTVASSGASQTLTLPSGGIGTFDVTLTAATVTLTFAGATAGKADTLTVIARQDGTGGRTITWPGSVTWVGGPAPTLSTAAGAADIFTFITVNGGTSWYGFTSPASPRGRSTGWFTNAGSRSSNSVAAGSVLAVPLDVGAVTLTQLAINCTALAASSTVRLGIYSDLNGVPSSLLLDVTGGTPLDTSTSGVKTTGTFSLAISGRVWLVANVQGGNPTLVTAANSHVDKLAYDSATNALGFQPAAYTAAAITSGSLPSTYTVNNATTTGVVIAAKVG